MEAGLLPLYQDGGRHYCMKTHAGPLAAIGCTPVRADACACVRVHEQQMVKSLCTTIDEESMHNW